MAGLARLTVDVVGPAGQRRLSLPADAPLVEVLPGLVRLLGDAAGGELTDPSAWLLSPPIGAPLARGSSLSASGILPGSVLYLIRSQLAVDAEGELPPHALARIRTPAQRTAALLPRRLDHWQRFRAALSPGPQTPVVASPTPHPAAFARTRPTTPWRRAWEAWRALDYARRLDAAIVEPRLRRGVTVAVMSPVAGTGKTTVTSLLGTLMALLRRDRIIAVDPVTGAGSLSGTLAPGHRAAAPAVLEALADRELNLTRLDSRLGRAPHGLMVLPVAGSLGTSGGALDRLKRFAGVVLLDCPADLDDAGRRAAAELADQVLLVCDDQPSTAAAVTEAGVALSRGGHPVLIVVNRQPRRGGRVDLGRLAAGLHQAEGMVVIPDSPAGAARLAAGRFDWRDAPREWRGAVRELAATLVAEWPRLGLGG